MIHRCIISARHWPDNAYVHTKPHARDPRRVIRELRERRGFSSDRALALAAGIPQPTLARYLNGQTKAMDTANLRAIADALQVSTSELLGEAPISAGGQVRELTEILEQLSDSQRDVLLATARALLSSSGSGGNR